MWPKSSCTEVCWMLDLIISQHNKQSVSVNIKMILFTQHHSLGSVSCQSYPQTHPVCSTHTKDPSKSQTNPIFQSDIFSQPTARLPSRPIWKNPPPADFTTQSAWTKGVGAQDYLQQTSGVKPLPTGPWQQPPKKTVVNPQQIQDWYMAPAWFVFTNRAAAQACAHAETSKQWNISLKPACSQTERKVGHPTHRAPGGNCLARWHCIC